MKYRRLFRLSAGFTALGILLTAYGFFNYQRNLCMNQAIYSILEKYGTEYPMPEAEVNELNRLFSWTIPSTVSRVAISYWGPVPNSTDTRMQRVAYSYDTGRMAVSIYSEHSSALSQWNMELSECRSPQELLVRFLAAALLLFLLSAVLWIGGLYQRQKAFPQTHPGYLTRLWRP